MAARPVGSKAQQQTRRRVAKARKAYTTASRRVARVQDRLARAQAKLARRAARLARAEAALGNTPARAAVDPGVPSPAVAQDAYCVKCKTKRPLRQAHQVVLNNGRRALQGPCPVCGTTLTQMQRSQETQPQPSG